MPGLDHHLGTWTGTWKTYLEPDKLYDEGPISATVRRTGDDYTIDYQGRIGDDDVSGSLRWEQSAGTTTVDWVDSWHTAGKTERLEGTDGQPPSFQYGDDDPWTWDITIATAPDGITIAHHNAGPGIPRYLGVVMELETRSSS